MTVVLSIFLSNRDMVLELAPVQGFMILLAADEVRCWTRLHFRDPSESTTQVMRLSSLRDTEENLAWEATGLIGKAMKGQTADFDWATCTPRPPKMSSQLYFLRTQR